MRLLKLNGKEVNKNVNKYLIRWDAAERSKFQFNVKQFLRKYWHNHIVYSEFPVFGTLMHIDIYNATLKVAVEVSGDQHLEFNKHFHKGNRLNFLSQIKRDMDKLKFCEINNIKMIEIYSADLELLSPKFFVDKFGLNL